MVVKRSSGPKLPGQLLDELGSEQATSTSRPKGKPKREPRNRKAQRKALRVEKKALRHQHHSRRNAPEQAVERGEEEDGFIANPWGRDDDVSEDEAPLQRVKPTPKKSSKPSTATISGDLRPSSLPPKVPRKAEEKFAADDAEIAALEEKLGLKHASKLPQSFEEDGLGDLLDGLDDFVASTGKRKREEYEEWLKNKRRKEDTDVFEGFSDDVELHSACGSEEELGDPDLDLGDEDGMGDTNEGLPGESDFGEDSEEYEHEQPPDRPKPRVRENPYRPPIAPDTDAAPSESGQKYIPPALRGALSSDAEILAKLKRQLQGLLNRLSEANMVSILKEVEQVYLNNSRQHVTSTLIDLLLALVSDRTSLNDTFIILHAGFIASVYKVTGTQFGAQFLDRLVAEVDKYYRGQSFAYTGSKETTNLIALLTELYTFQLLSSTVIFDYIRLFLGSLSELNTELLLKIIRNCGPQLRSEDPSALKDIVLRLQRAVTESGGEEKLPVRTKFMIETINNLKNNRQKAGAEASALAQEHRRRMRKALGTLNARAKANEPLGMSLDDLRRAKKEGQWWLVGARWKNPSESLASNETSHADHHSNDEIPNGEAEGDADIPTLARRAGMNTAIRRAIFTTLLSSTDYKDCQTRLQKLGLNRKQELEIPRVLLHCAAAEEGYNRYYGLVAKQLCRGGGGGHGGRMRMGFQFALWGVWRGWGERFVGASAEDGRGGEDLEARDGSGKEEGLREVVNLAKMYGDLVGDEILPITILKTLDFAYLKDKTRLFVEVMLVTVMQKKGRDEEGIIRTFAKAKDAVQMVVGLKFFLENVAAKTDVVSMRDEKKIVSNGCKAAVTALGLLANASSSA